MDSLKIKIGHEWIQGELVEKPKEKVEAIIFHDKNNNSIISLEDFSFLTGISLTSLKNYIRNNHILHYHISSKWFINLENFFLEGERVLE